MKCCLCNEEIEIENGWDEGNNAEPLVEGGRGCNHCDNFKVIPERLRLMEIERK